MEDKRDAGEGGKIRVEVDGIAVEVARETLADDLDTLEMLADADGGNVLAMPRLFRHVFGEEQYARIKVALSDGEGRTSLTAMSDFLSKVFAAIGGEAKN